jgi:hypothetical protein
MSTSTGTVSFRVQKLSGQKLTTKGQVLVAEMRDVRPFARLLRGIGIKHVRLTDLTICQEMLTR